MVAGAGSIHKTFYCEFSSGLKLGKHPNLTHIFVIWSQEYQQTTVGIQDYVWMIASEKRGYIRERRSCETQALEKTGLRNN